MTRVSRGAATSLERTWAVIPAWRSTDDLLAAVESIIREGVAPARIVVVDNGSGEPYVSEIESGLAALGTRQVYLAENSGFASAVNRGIREALRGGAEYVLLLNDDARLEPSALPRLLATLEDWPGAGCAAPRIVYAEEPGVVWLGGGHYSRWRAGVRPEEKNTRVEDLPDSVRNVSFASGCALLVRREVFASAGLFDEQLFMYEEDVEFCRRVVAADFAIALDPRALVSHKIGRHRAARITPFVLYHLARSRMIRVRRGDRPELVIGLLTHWLLYTPVRMLQVLAAGAGIRAARAWIAGSFAGLRLPLRTIPGVDAE